MSKRRKFLIGLDKRVKIIQSQYTRIYKTIFNENFFFIKLDYTGKNPPINLINFYKTKSLGRF